MFTSFVGFKDSVTFPLTSFESFPNGLKNPTAGTCSTNHVAKILRGEGGGFKKPRPVGSINSVQTGKHCPLISQVAQDFDFCRHAQEVLSSGVSRQTKAGVVAGLCPPPSGGTLRVPPQSNNLRSVWNHCKSKDCACEMIESLLY